MIGVSSYIVVAQNLEPSEVIGRGDQGQRLRLNLRHCRLGSVGRCPQNDMLHPQQIVFGSTSALIEPTRVAMCAHWQRGDDMVLVCVDGLVPR